MTGPLNVFNNLSVQKPQFMSRFPPLALYLFQFQLFVSAVDRMILNPFYDKIKTKCTDFYAFLLKKVKRSWA